MSPLSNSDSPYKSRVLNFINRQYLRLGDRAQTGLRKLQTATVWGIQIIAYPIYLLVQTSTQLGKELKSKTVKLLSPADEEKTSSVGSQPTTVVLSSIRPWLKNTHYQLFPLPQSPRSFWERLQFWRKPSPDEETQPKFKSPSPPQKTGFLSKIPVFSATSGIEENYLIQGVATYLETGELVLVTTENQVIDLLSEAQQAQLKERMKVVLECYENIQQPWWWRISAQGKQAVLNPLYWLAKLMIWVQKSSLAKRLNWFQESQLSFRSGYEEISQTPPVKPKLGIIEKLDRALAGWENSQLAPVIKQIRKQTDDPNNPIVNLIRSAVDYFYGRTSQKSLKGETNPNESSASPSLPQPISNLVQGTKTVINRVSKGKVKVDSETGEVTEFDQIKNLIQAAIEHFFGNSNDRIPSLAEEIESKDEPWLTKTDVFASNASPKALTPATETSQDFSTAIAYELTGEVSISEESEKTGEEWQTEAIPMGYEKHILTKILEALDRVLAWLEGKLIKIWQRLKAMFTRNSQP